MLPLLLACIKPAPTPDTPTPASPAEAIAVVEAVLAGDPDEPLKISAMWNLAELHIENGRRIFLDEMEAYGEAYDACALSMRPIGECDDLRPDETRSLAALEEGLAIFAALLDTYPEHRRADEARYLLALYSVDVGRPQAALGHHRQLLADHPDSPWAAEAWLFLAEDAFEQGRLEEAARGYEEVRQHGAPDRVLFATYKLSWCYYNIGDLDTAIALNDETLALGETMSWTKGLRYELLQNRVRFAAESGRVDETLALLDALPDGRGRRLTRQLATELLERGKSEESAAIWEALLAADPLSPEAPYFAQQQVDCLVNLGRYSEAEAIVAAMKSDYGSGSDWARANPTGFREAAQQRSRAMNRLAAGHAP